MAFSFLKKLFGCSDEKAEESTRQNVETAAGDSCCANDRRDDDCTRRKGADGKSNRRRNAPPRKEPESQSHREPREAPSNLSPEQQREAIDKLNVFVNSVAKSLVNFPDQITTEIITTPENQNTIQISCAKGDAGKIIGRNGKIITAIRTLVSGNAARNGLRVTVDIKD